MKKILIFYGKYGGGHFSAAKSIKDYIDKFYSNYDVEIVDCIEYVNKFVNKITTGMFSSIVKNSPKLWGKIYRGSNSGLLGNFSNTANKLMAKKLYKLIRNFEPDLIISVLPFSSNMCSYLKKHGKINCKYATIMTDFGLHNQWLRYGEYNDYIFVAHDGMRNSLLERGLNKDKIFSTGIPISPRFSETFSSNEIHENLGLSKDLPICILFGGGEFGFSKELIEKVFSTLISNFENIQVIAIAGKNEKIKSDFEKIVNNLNKNKFVKVLGFTDKVPELMSISSFVISKSGGLTTSECIASNLPMFIVSPLPGQEEDNARFIEANNAGYWLKNNDDIKSCLDSFINNLDTMKDNCNKIGKKNSTKDICKILLG